MHPGLAYAFATDAAPTRNRPNELLGRFVRAYWLRPENAFWMTLRSETLACCPLERPSVDLSCGDGVFTFLHAGGVFDPAFDVFTSVCVEAPGPAGQRDEAPQGGTCVRSEQPDTTGRERGADMFDHVDEQYHPVIVTRPSPERRIDVGTDIKPALLAKAQRLKFYGRLVEHDNNRPLPFGDDSFQTVYCNSAYWVAKIEQFLAEMARITRPSGRIILQVKLDCMRRYTLEAHRYILGDRFLKIVEGDRLESWPTLADESTWAARFAAAGLLVERAIPFATKTHAYIWDVGLRPVAPMLVKMARALTPDVRVAIKREWVDLVSELLEPLCDPSFNVPGSQDEPAEIQYVLTPA